MEVALFTTLVWYSLIMTYVSYKYKKENNYLTKEYGKIKLNMELQQAINVNQEDDINRQLSNLFSYNGTPIGQRKKADLDD